MKKRIKISIMFLIFINAYALCFPLISSSGQEQDATPNVFRTVTHLHTCFSHDAQFGSEPNLQIRNLQDRGYQVVFFSEHDYSNIGSAQSDFTISPLKNGGFETGYPYPTQWRLITVPKSTSTFFNTTTTERYNTGDQSFHLSLIGNTPDFDMLSWAYWEKGNNFLRDRPIAYNLWIRFSVYFNKVFNSQDSTAYITLSLGRRQDPDFPSSSHQLVFYFGDDAWNDPTLPVLTNGSNRVAIRLDAPQLGEWTTYSLNVSEYAFQMFPMLDEVPVKYLMLKEATLNLNSRNGAHIQWWIDDVQIFSEWSSAEMYDWWRNDIESYTTDDFLAVAGLETSILPHIGAYGLSFWHNFSIYQSVEERIDNIHAVGAVSSINHPRAFNFKAISESVGWGAELLEIYNTMHDDHPSSQVLNLWDQLLTQGHRIFGVAGFDSHGVIDSNVSYQYTVLHDTEYENLIIADSLTKTDVISALRHGRLYLLRSDHSLRLSFSINDGEPQQGDGIIYTSSQSDATVTLSVTNATLGSQIVIIKNGAQILEIDLLNNSYYQELRVPLTEEYTALRVEIYEKGEIIALSNPLLFKRVTIPPSSWVYLDPLRSSSSATLVKGSNDQIEVQLLGPTGSQSWILMKIPRYPREVLLENNDYSNHPSLNIDELSTKEHGWIYNEIQGILTIKITHHGLGTVYIDYATSETVTQPIFLYALLGSTIIVTGLLSYYIVSSRISKNKKV